MSINGIHVVITGPMGVGKSTVADGLAAALERAHRDSDRDLEVLFGRSGAQLAVEAGIDELHRLESSVLLGALVQDRPLVISAAAWVVEDERCREAMDRRARTVVLTAPVDELLARIPTGDHRRAMDRSELEALMDRRRSAFEAVADLTLEATVSPADLVTQILDTWRSGA